MGLRSHIYLAILSIGFFLCALGCAQKDVLKTAVPESAPVALPKDVLRGLTDSIFEVVVPKKEDTFVRYERSLPVDQIPYQVRNDHYFGLGTAFAVGPNRFLSAGHVFRLGTPTLWQDYSLRDAKGEVHKIGNIHKFNSDLDLIEFDLLDQVQGIRPVVFNRNIEVGDTIFSVGDALGEGISYRSGVVASFTPEPISGRWKYIRFSAPASPGNSGGPLIDIHGNVVGVVVAKNQTENLNVAVPISQYDSLTEGKAEMMAHHLELKIDTHRTEPKKWEKTAKLPRPLNELRQEAESGLNKKFGELLVELRDLDKKSRESSGFKEFLTHQGRVSRAGLLTYDEHNYNWSLREVNWNKVQIGPDQNAYLARHSGGGVVIVAIERPKSDSYSDLIKSSKRLMDIVLQVSPQNWVWSKEPIHAVSYGEPKEQAWWRDTLGRPWHFARWYFENTDSYAELNCTPSPSEVICVSLHAPVSNLMYPHDELVHDLIDRTIISYHGTLKEWRDFLSLSKDHVPEFFASSKITLEPGGNLHIHMNPYQVSLREASINEEETRLYVNLGYKYAKNTKAPSLQILNVTVDPMEHNYLQFYSVFAPQKDSAKTRKDLWAHINERSGHFDSKPFLEKNYNRIKIPLLTSGTDVAHVVDCSRDSSESADGLQDMCDRFKDGLVIQ